MRIRKEIFNDDLRLLFLLVCSLLHALNPNLSARFFIFSSSTTELVPTFVSTFGASDFLASPFSSPNLKEKIRIFAKTQQGMNCSFQSLLSTRRHRKIRPEAQKKLLIVFSRRSFSETFVEEPSESFEEASPSL